MGILWLFNSLGYIFGLAVLLGLVIGLYLCYRAYAQPASSLALKRALLASFLPFAFGLLAAVTGPIILAVNGKADDLNGWLASGKAALAGFVVTLLPLVWTLSMLRGRRAMA